MSEESTAGFTERTETSLRRLCAPHHFYIHADLWESERGTAGPLVSLRRALDDLYQEARREAGRLSNDLSPDQRRWCEFWSPPDLVGGQLVGKLTVRGVDEVSPLYRLLGLDVPEFSYVIEQVRTPVQRPLCYRVSSSPGTPLYLMSLLQDELRQNWCSRLRVFLSPGASGEVYTTKVGHDLYGYYHQMLREEAEALEGSGQLVAEGASCARCVGQWDCPSCEVIAAKLSQVGDSMYDLGWATGARRKKRREYMEMADYASERRYWLARWTALKEAVRAPAGHPGVTRDELAKTLEGVISRTPDPIGVFVWPGRPGSLATTDRIIAWLDQRYALGYCADGAASEGSYQLDYEQCPLTSLYRELSSGFVDSRTDYRPYSSPHRRHHVSHWLYYCFLVSLAHSGAPVSFVSRGIPPLRDV